MPTFSAQVSAWVNKSQRRIDTVFKESAQDVITIMQEVGPSVANPDSTGGGHMPVDTGALRASLQAALNSPGQVVFRPPSGSSIRYDPSPVALVIASAKPGDTIYATYSVEYAKAMEYRYGFVRLAAQQWQDVVSRAAARVKARVTAALGSAAPS